MPKRTDSTGGVSAGRARLRMLAMRSDNSRGSNGFGDVVVRADLQALDAALGFIARGEHQDRHGRRGAQRARQLKAGFARHHHVEDQQIEAQTLQLARASTTSSRV